MDEQSETNPTDPVEKEKSLGQYLKSQREIRQISYLEITKATKISENVLRRLEADQFDALPPPPFVKGFLKSVGKHLGLDVHDLLLRYEQVLGRSPSSSQPRIEPLNMKMARPPNTGNFAAKPSAPRPATISRPTSPKSDDMASVNSSWEKWFNRKTIPIYMVVLFVVVIASLLRMIGKENVSEPLTAHESAQTPSSLVNRPAPPLPDVPVDTSAQPAIAPAQPPMSSATPATPAAPAAPETPLQTAAPQTTPPPKTETPEQPTTPAAVAPKADVTTETPVVVTTTEPAPPPAESKPLPSGEYELTIQAKVDTFFKVQQADQEIQRVTLRAGESTNIKTKEKVKIQVTNAGSITISHNGKAIKRFGAWGESKILEFNASGVQ